MYRGEIWWANLPDPVGSEPGYRRPVLIIQDDTFTQSPIRTIIVVIITSNTRLTDAPGNVLSCKATRLPKDSVANVSQIFTLDKTFLSQRVGALPEYLQEEVDEGLRAILYLYSEGTLNRELLTVYPTAKSGGLKQGRRISKRLLAVKNIFFISGRYSHN